MPGLSIFAPLSTKRLTDALIGWSSAAPHTRVRLLEEFCGGIRMRTLLTNSLTALLVFAFVLAGAAREARDVAWLVIALLAGIMPRAYAAWLRRRGHFHRDTERKALTFVAISALYGLIWGIGPVLVLPGLGGAAIGAFLVIIIFATVMGPYAAMPGILYVRLFSTGVPTLIAIALNTTPRVTLVSVVLFLWLLLRADAWRGYHRALRREIDLRELVEAQREELKRDNWATQRVNDNLKVLAETDPLTGVANRRQFIRVCESLVGPAAVLLFDIDRFKPINDRFGHHAGDLALTTLVRLVEEVLRKGDLLARLGGDEFALVLPNVTPDKAWLIAERIRGVIGQRAVRFQGQLLHYTISIGIANIPAESRRVDTDALLRHADELLYAAKSAGRNQTRSDSKQDGDPPH